MANTVIQLKHSTLTGNVPASLANGEISINSFDGKFFYSTPAGVVVTHYPYPGPAGLNGEIQFNDSGVLGTNSGLTFSKTTGYFTAPIVASSNNGNGTNFKVGDDIWIGDVNIADTLRLTGQQNVNNAYIIFGASDTKKLGRSGTGALTYDGGFTANGEISSLQSSGDEGGQINLAVAATNTSLNGSVAIDIYQNKIRIFETGGTNRGVYIDMANGAATSVGTDLLSPSSATDGWARGQANAAFIQANTPSHVANSAASYANAAFAVANSDTSAANTGAAYANSAFAAANSASLYANAGFAVANSGSIYANSGFSLANTANTTANSAQLYANSAFLAANNSAGVNLTQNTNITNAGTYANSAFLRANTPIHTANSAALYANGAFTRANNSINANTGGTISANLVIAGANLVVANGATEVFNVRSWSTSGLTATSNSTGTVTITGGVGVKGNVWADAIYDGGVEVLVQANAAFLAANTPSHVANSAASYANSGFAVANSGASYANSGFAVANSAALYANSAFLSANNGNGVDLTQNTNISSAASYANSAFLVANTPTHVANSAASYANSGFAVANSGASYANSAYTRANNSVNANTGGIITGDITITGNLIIQGNTFTSNAGILTSNDTLFLLGTGNYTSDALDVGFAAHYNAGTNAHTGFIRDVGTKEWYIFKNYTPEVGANNNININDASFTIDTLNANLKSTVITLKGIDLLPYVNNAYTAANTADTKAVNSGAYANSAFLAANTPTHVANSAASYANSGFAVANSGASYANSAFSVANNGVGVDATQNTNITNVGTYANSAFAAANTATATDATQNTNITAVSSYANSAFIHANAAFNTANTAGGATIGDVLALSIALG